MQRQKESMAGPCSHSAAATFLATVSSLSPEAHTTRGGTTTGPDEDWDLTQMLYHKMKKIPEGDDKVEMQIELQQVVMGLLQIFTLLVSYLIKLYRSSFVTYNPMIIV